MAQTTTQPQVELRKRHAKTVQITASEKIIADISTGIYRTPAAALKELIANAYDADATEVRIETDAPRFSQLVVRDDGCGMSLDRFLEIVQHIGGSRKRIDSPTGYSPVHNRKLIGRIGIGLLSVAQLGQRFYISSTVKGSRTRFLAEIDLRPFHKDDAALRRLGEQRDGDEIDIGSVRYVDGLPEASASHYTVITVPDPKAGLISEMQSQLRTFIKSEPTFTLGKRAKSFQQIVETVQKSKRADIVLDSYHYLAWELGLLCPVKYLEGGPFLPATRGRRRIVGADEIELEEPQNFTVMLDGLDIRRPILFPNPRATGYAGPDPAVHPINWREVVAGREVSISGYVYVQQPHVDCHELNGVQLRVRGVGVGPYDKSLMGYPYDEGIKFGQVSAEIYVKDGLESALNIDRSSFRETDPHYLAIRAYLWNVLQKTVFPLQKSAQKTVKAQKDEAKQEEDEKVLEKALKGAPAGVGSRPTVSPKPPAPARGRSTEKTPGPKEARKPKTVKPGHYQTIVVVAKGQAQVDRDELEEAAKLFGLKKDAKTRLLRVAGVLAAYDVWDSLSPEQARGLFHALAAAVRS